MIRISKETAKALRKLGVGSKDNGISRTSNGRSFYLCESAKNMKLLAKLGIK